MIGDLTEWMLQHGASLVSMVFAARAMLAARARKEQASADAIEDLRRAHQACTAKAEELEGRVELAERAAEVASRRSSEMEQRASVLAAELRALRAEIRR